MKSRYWFVVIQIENMKKAGLTAEQINDPVYVANYFLNRWTESAPSRTGCVTVCKSADGLYHLHAALYGEKTTLTAVSKLMYDSHVEKCEGGKTKMMEYILKEGEYAENGEKILYETGRENIKTNRGSRTDLLDIEDYINQGMTPREIMDMKFSYRRYEKEIKSAYASKRYKDAPLRKNMYVEWHVGESGTGKSYTYDKLCKTNDVDNIYFTGYMTNGWLDKYMEQGAPDILFMDEMKPSGSWQELLNVLDVYSKRSIHCRYGDAYPLWTKVHITSIFPPEEIYRQMVKEENKANDSFKQLLRRITKITYHYVENGEYREFSIPASQYTNYEDLKKAAHQVIHVKCVAVVEEQEAVNEYSKKVTDG